MPAFPIGTSMVKSVVTAKGGGMLPDDGVTAELEPLMTCEADRDSKSKVAEVALPLN